MNMHNNMIEEEIYNDEHPEEVKAKQMQREYERKANEAWLKRIKKQQNGNENNE